MTKSYLSTISLWLIIRLHLNIHEWDMIPLPMFCYLSPQLAHLLWVSLVCLPTGFIAIGWLSTDHSYLMWQLCALDSGGSNTHVDEFECCNPYILGMCMTIMPSTNNSLDDLDALLHLKPHMQI